METTAAASVKERPGATLDNVRAVFWHSYRHLFPPHSLAAQTPNGIG